MKKVLLAGNAITADILCGYLRGDARYEVVGLVVDDHFVETGQVAQVESVGISQVATSYAPGDVTVIMAMGYGQLNRARESMFLRLKELGYTLETYVHPDARVYTDEPLGAGCVILPNAVVEPHAQVGENTMVWCNVTLAHHSRVEANCWVASGTVLSGQAAVRRNTFVGVNATIVNEVTVGEYNIIGAAAMISKDTKPNTVHLARSAEPFRFSSDDYVKHFGV